MKEEIYINFIKKDNFNDAFTVIADNDQDVFKLIKMYVLQGYEFEF